MLGEIEQTLGRPLPDWQATYELELHAAFRAELTVVERFDGRIFSATDVAHGQPAPDLFLHAALRMGVDPRCCVVVEDSPSGVAAAQAAGTRCFAFAGGVNPADKLEGHSTVVFDLMDELPALLAALP